MPFATSKCTNEYQFVSDRARTKLRAWDLKAHYRPTTIFNMGYGYGREDMTPECMDRHTVPGMKSASFRHPPAKKRTNSQSTRNIAILAGITVTAYVACLLYYHRSLRPDQDRDDHVLFSHNDVQDTADAMREHLHAVPMLPSYHSTASASSDGVAASLTLRFSVCNGLTNQRISLLYGIMLALRTGRVPVLPDLIPDGTQSTDARVDPSSGNVQAFSAIYDLPHFLSSLQAAGIPIVLPSAAPPVSLYQNVTVEQLGWDTYGSLSSSKYASIPHLAMDCPLWKVPLSAITQEELPLLWAVLRAFTPTAEITHVVHGAIRAITHRKVAASSSSTTSGSTASGSRSLQLGGSSSSSAGKHLYNMVHLRLEQDWAAHCAKWGSIKDGFVRDNCMNNTMDIQVSLQLFGYLPEIPLYIGSYWEGADPAVVDLVLARIRAAGYTVVRLSDVLQTVHGVPREQLALIEYELAMRAHRLVWV